MVSCPLTRPHQGSCVIQASLRCPNRLPLGNPSESQACSQRQIHALPEIGNALQGTSSCFSLKNTQASLLLMDFSTHSFPTLPAGALLPLHRASRRCRICCSPSPCPLCSWILPLAPSSQHPFLGPAHIQELAARSCPGWPLPRQTSQSHKQAVLVSYAFFFFLLLAISQGHPSQIQGCLHLSHR